MLRQEMDFGYFRFIHRPAEKLGVFDNASDYEVCKQRVHCNCTHGSIAPAVVYDGQQKKYVLDYSGVDEGFAAMNDMKTGRRHTILWCGDHNNVYFPDFVKYKTTLPECLMQTIDGKYLELRDILIQGGEGIPMPAIDDPTLIGLNCESMAVQARRLRDSQFVTAYVLGMEELYPEYFALGFGDFRPASWHHFLAWCETQGITDVPTKEEILSKRGSPAWLTWHQFREQAMADRCSSYYRAVLNEDDNHLAFYPTHGSTLSDDRRWQLGQQPATIACACDGMEMGHILIENDAERRNVIMTGHYAAFGAPVIVPRLGNKQPDLSAIGGGRSFTPQTLRRLVYECAGLGISTIFPIHWSSRLHDGEWFIKDTAAEAECRAVFDELTEAAPYLSGMGRLQPQIGLLAGDATWIRQWDPRWTALMQDAIEAHVHMTVISDTLAGASLAGKMPVLVIPANPYLKPATMDALMEYVQAGGKAVVWGEFAVNEPDLNEKRSLFLAHKNVLVVDAPALEKTRILRELFLSGPEHGIDGPTFEFSPIDSKAVFEAIRSFAPECVLQPARLQSDDDLSQVNVYTLTDRMSLLFVLVNNGGAPVTLHLTPDERLMGNYALMDVLSREQLSKDIALAPGGTRMIWCYAPVMETQIEPLIVKAEKAYLNWKAACADVSALRLNYAAMRCGPHLQKRAALAMALLNSLVIIPRVKPTAQGVSVYARVLDSNMQSVENASVRMRITPGSFASYAFEGDGGGFKCDVKKEALPPCYDMQNMEYAPLSGRVRLVISAENESRNGGCVVSADL